MKTSLCIRDTDSTKVYHSFQCFGSTSFWSTSGNTGSKKFQFFFFLFFSVKDIILNKMFFFVIYGLMIHVYKKQLVIKKQTKLILVILVDFKWVYHDFFFAIRIQIHVSWSGSGSDPMNGSEILIVSIIK